MPTQRQTNTPAPTPTPAPMPETCALGRQLGNCQLRRVGCGSLYEVLRYLYPPSELLAQLNAWQATGHPLDTTVAAWLARLETVRPQPRHYTARKDKMI